MDIAKVWDEIYSKLDEISDIMARVNDPEWADFIEFCGLLNEAKELVSAREDALKAEVSK